MMSLLGGQETRGESGGSGWGGEIKRSTDMSSSQRNECLTREWERHRDDEEVEMMSHTDAGKGGRLTKDKAQRLTDRLLS